jgi:hypothetical protein
MHKSLVGYKYSRTGTMRIIKFLLGLIFPLRNFLVLRYLTSRSTWPQLFGLADICFLRLLYGNYLFTLHRNYLFLLSATWTVVSVGDRNAYMHSLERAGIGDTYHRLR